MSFNSTTSGDSMSYGWTSSPPRRGTADILTSCLLTVFLCCWTSVYPNIPALSDSKWDQMHDKMTLAMVALLGPEFLLGFAAGQISSARASVQKFRENNYPEWTLTHAFYADMGGFLLKTKHEDKDIIFPVNAKQLHYLIKNNYLEYPRIRIDEIKDKNKADGLARLITVVQATWFFVNTITRAAQNLAITTLELTTLSFIVVMFATSFYWYHKPSDVSTPTILVCDATIEQIHDKAGVTNKPWAQTPLDFVSRREHSLSKVWLYYNQIMRTLRLPLYSRPIMVKPRDRIPSDTWYKVSIRYEIYSSIFIVGFGATFMAGWNFHFPTATEKAFWRAASSYNLFFSTVGAGYVWLWEHFIPRYRKAGNSPRREILPHTRRTIGDRIRNNSSPHDPELGISVGFIAPITVLCVIYCICRVYIIVEEFAGLRSLPNSAFQTVEWSNYVPHL